MKCHFLLTSQWLVSCKAGVSAAPRRLPCCQTCFSFTQLPVISTSGSPEQQVKCFPPQPTQFDSWMPLTHLILPFGSVCWVLSPPSQEQGRLLKTGNQYPSGASTFPEFKGENWPMSLSPWGNLPLLQMHSSRLKHWEEGCLHIWAVCLCTHGVYILKEWIPSWD